MSRQINQPINQVRLTNVAVVRMNQGGKRFEIACYRNKVVDYRQGLEQDLSEVLQTERIFTNVSKGQFANAKDLQKVFGTKDEQEIAKLILTKGQLQVSDKERNQQLDKTIAQVAEWISKNCVHPASERPYTISQIRHAMQQANFAVHPTKPLKRQYLDCVKTLQSVIPIMRAKMELALFVPASEQEIISETLQKYDDVIWNIADEGGFPKEEDTSKQYSQQQVVQFRVLVDPSLYRVFNDVVQPMDGGRVEIVTQVVTKQGDTNLEAEVDYEDGLIIDLGLKDDGHGDHDEVNDQVGLESFNITGGYLATSDKNDSESEDDEDIPINRRKQQKKANKRKEKAKRREDDDLVMIKEQDQPTASELLAGDRVSSSFSKDSSGDVNRQSCNTCGGFFDSSATYRAHFKSDWHRFNQKLKLKGAAPISEQEFLMCDSGTFFSGDL